MCHSISINVYNGNDPPARILSAWKFPDEKHKINLGLRYVSYVKG